MRLSSLPRCVICISSFLLVNFMMCLNPSKAEEEKRPSWALFLSPAYVLSPFPCITCSNVSLKTYLLLLFLCRVSFELDQELIGPNQGQSVPGHGSGRSAWPGCKRQQGSPFQHQFGHTLSLRTSPWTQGHLI